MWPPVSSIASNFYFSFIVTSDIFISLCKINKQIMHRRLYSKFINVVEVGVRDGLQNERNFVPTATKAALIHRLAEAGLSTIEVTSFVSPKWVPQMSDSSILFSSVSPKLTNISLPVLVPNVKGLEEALKVGAKEIAVFVSASESFSQKNTNCSIEESLARLKKVTDLARLSGIEKIRGYVSCVIACPLEGKIDASKVECISRVLLSDLQCHQVSLGDTIGVGTAGDIRRLLDRLTRSVDCRRMAVHCHDTFGQALANILVAVEEYGITTVDAAVAGLGGCPFAPGATGNVSTEDVVYMLHGLGYETGIDLDKLVAAGKFICDEMERPNCSRAGNAILRRSTQ